MRVFLKPVFFKGLRGINEKYEALLKFSKQMMDAMNIRVEEITVSKLYAIPLSELYRSGNDALETTVTDIGLDNEFNLKSEIDGSLSFKYSFMLIEFIGRAADEDAVFTLYLRGDGDEKKRRGDIEIHAYNDKFDGFENLIVRGKVSLRRVLRMRDIKTVILDLS